MCVAGPLARTFYVIGKSRTRHQTRFSRSGIAEIIKWAIVSENVRHLCLIVEIYEKLADSNGFGPCVCVRA